jgi:hypothetical protein
MSGTPEGLTVAATVRGRAREGARRNDRATFSYSGEEGETRALRPYHPLDNNGDRRRADVR